MLRCPPAARSLAITGECVVFRSGVINLQLAVCAEEFRIDHTHILLLNRGTTTKPPLLLYVRLAKLSRVCNILVTGQTPTDSAHIFASSVGWAQPTLVVRCPPVACSLAIMRGHVVFRSGVINLQLAVCAEELGTHRIAQQGWYSETYLCRAQPCHSENISRCFISKTCCGNTFYRSARF